MLDLEPRHLAIVAAIIRDQLPGREVRAFGSRINGRASRFSDLDLVVMGGPVGWAELGRVRDDFSESDLPFKVDLMAWDDLTPEFRKIIEADYVAVPGIPVRTKVVSG